MIIKKYILKLVKLTTRTSQKISKFIGAKIETKVLSNYSKFEVLETSYDPEGKLYEIKLINQTDLRNLDFIYALWNTLETIPA